MNQTIKFTINGKECCAEKGAFILAAAIKNGVYIPSLCNIDGVTPRGSCRICTVKVNGKMMSACTTPVSDGMKIETDTPELSDLRKQIIELLFVEGNHFCPTCEKSGRCELQAIAYRFQVLVPRFPYQFTVRNVEATNPKLIKDHNRCILCKRCIRAIKDKDGKSLFAFKNRGHHLTINIDTKLAESISDELAKEAAEICPVGALLLKEKGFDTPIQSRKFEKNPIGSEVDNAASQEEEVPCQNQ